MSTFFIIGKYSPDRVGQVSSERTRQVRQAIEQFDGHIRGMYALLGDWDVVLIVELRDSTEAMKAALALTKITGVSFSARAAVPVADFDWIAEEVALEMESSGMMPSCADL